MTLKTDIENNLLFTMSSVYTMSCLGAGQLG